MAVQKTIGGTMITGDHIELFQMKAQLAALKLEMLGLRHSSGRSMYAALKRRYNLHGTKQSVADQFAALIAEMEQPAPEIPAPYLLMDDNTDKMHGQYDTLTDAKRAAHYDWLTAWTIYSGGLVVAQCPAATPDEEPRKDTSSLEDAGKTLGSYAT